jgi:hypothetical protein
VWGGMRSAGAGGLTDSLSCVQGRILRQARRFSSYAPPGAGGGNDNSAAITLLGLGAVVGYVCFVINRDA